MLATTSYIEALHYSAEDRVFVVEPRSGHGGDKELTAIGARTCISHRDGVWAIVSVHAWWDMHASVNIDRVN